MHNNFIFAQVNVHKMEDLLLHSEKLIHETSLGFRRYLYDHINWSNRLIGVKGARGTGKTTLLLQYLKTVDLPISQKAYLTLDDIYFSGNSLLESGKTFYQMGGKLLVLDEVHKYPTWAQEIKNLYDRYPDLKIIFTGSSIVDIAKQEGDLSRRALMYELKGLSYREYLFFKKGYIFPSIPLETLIDPKNSIRNLLDKDFKPLAYFQEYLKTGYYPYEVEDPRGFYQRLKQQLRLIVEYDMAELKGFDIRHAKKMLQLLFVVAQQVPFKPNIIKLAEKTGIHRNSINNYLYYLEEARILSLLQSSGTSTALLQKPEKVYLENSNLLYALSEELPSLGAVREIFFNNQLGIMHHLSFPKKGDFLVNGKYLFEIGGKNKSSKQITDSTQAWVVKDDIEYPIGKSIPLWLFGFLY
ncbi:AAA family ATPase [Mongoliibacter sp.]|uniref:ATP-binding protein n=1 Tax=Mongoliibacter sp. TaxID=2022438 RepID=UPI0025E247AE|nr:AAA family ATPase [Mongoliibacter sp.]